MDSTLLLIDPKKETEHITRFIRQVLEKQGFQNVIIAASGGIDSTTSLYLLRRALAPDHIFVVHLPYYKTLFTSVLSVATRLEIPKTQVFEVSIQKATDALADATDVNESNKIGFGNIMARARMVVLYDLAKKYRALVCGTENRSEYHLAYFTRFGDEASDFEPIRHLFKTQVYQLAKYLGAPKEIISKSPTAGLWQGQTDEDEFGFTYEEADQVLCLYFDKKLSVKEIQNKGFQNAIKVIDWVKKNSYKHHVPYVITQK